MKFSIREAQLSDAELLIQYMQELASEPGIDLLFEPREFDISVEEESRHLQEYRELDNSIFLLAMSAEGQIIGALNCTGYKRKVGRHVTRLGISVRRGWRDRGVGQALMGSALDWARSSGIVKRVELQVFARNARAIHLYEKHGFELEGRLRRAIYKEGEHLDTLLMSLLM